MPRLMIADKKLASKTLAVEEDKWELLKRIAKRKSKSVSELAREALDDYLEKINKEDQPT